MSNRKLPGWAGSSVSVTVTVSPVRPFVTVPVTVPAPIRSWSAMRSEAGPPTVVASICTKPVKLPVGGPSVVETTAEVEAVRVRPKTNVSMKTTLPKPSPAKLPHV